MNNIQKNFKSKAKCGIRAFSGGGLLDDFNARMKGLEESAASGGGFNTLPDTPSVASAMAEGQRNFDAGMGEGYEQAEQEPSPSNRVRTPGRTSIMTVSPRGLPAFQTGTSLKQFGQQAFADGGTVDPVEQLLSQMKNKYGGVAAPQAAAPAPAPVQPAPAPAPRPAQAMPTIQGAIQSIRSRQEALRGFAHGGEVEPFVDGAGFIHGAPGVDKVPAQVVETGEPIRVGSGERIVNKHQNAALEQLAQKTTGQPLDDYLEEATGKPVGPKMKKGIRAAANGFNLDEVNARAAQARAINPTAPAAPMMEPLEIPTAKPVTPAAPDTMFGKAKAAIGSVGEAVADKVRSIRGTAAPTAAPAATTAAERLNEAGKQVFSLKSVSDGVANAAKTVGSLPAVATDTLRRTVGALGKVAAPVAAIHDIATDPTGTGIAQGAFDIVGGMSPAGFMLAPADVASRVTNNGRGAVQTMTDRFDGSYVPETAAKGTDQILSAANRYLPDSVLKATGLKVNGDPDATSTLAAKGGEYRKQGTLTDSEYARLTAAPTKEELSKWNGPADPRTEAQIAAEKVANDPNVRSLRSAGVTGDVGGDDFEWKKDAVGRYSPTTGKTGIRTIDTPNGKVYAGRDAKGQLNVTSNLGQTGEESEAARAKEAARINADLKRQTETFDRLRLESDMKSNNPADRASAQQRMGLRTLDAEIARANQANETARRGQDMVLQGHQMDNQTKLATLKNQMLQQNLERNTKLIDDLYGGATLKTKDGEMPNEARRDFVNRLSKTLGQHGRTIGHLSPKDMVDFQIAYDMDKDGKNGSFMKFYNNWIAGAPEVEDFDPFRSTARAAGDEGKSNALGLYTTRNGSIRHEGSTVGKEFLTGTYDINRKRQLDQ